MLFTCLDSSNQERSQKKVNSAIGRTEQLSMTKAKKPQEGVVGAGVLSVILIVQ